MQRIYRRIPMPKCDSNKAALHAGTSAPPQICRMPQEHPLPRIPPDGRPLQAPA